MWPFKKRPLLDNASYWRWLRANRPPLQWFLERSEDEQEQMALLGDEYVRDVAVVIGYTVQDPVGVDARIEAEAGDLDGEETLARRLAAELAGRVLQQTRSDPPEAAETPPPVSMGGLGERRTQASLDREKAKGRALFGRPPDRIEA